MTVANIDKCLKIDNNALLKYVIGRIVRHISTANDKSAFCCSVGEAPNALKFLKKTLEPSAKPHANIVQVSAAKKFILEK